MGEWTVRRLPCPRLEPRGLRILVRKRQPLQLCTVHNSQDFNICEGKDTLKALEEHILDWSSVNLTTWVNNILWEDRPHHTWLFPQIPLIPFYRALSLLPSLQHAWRVRCQHFLFIGKGGGLEGPRDGNMPRRGQKEDTYRVFYTGSQRLRL